MPADVGAAAVVLLAVAVVAVVCLARRAILRRRAARRVARWTRELIDPMRLLAELTHPVTPGHDVRQSAGRPGQSHPEDG